ncbi:MAG: hypothetical protein PWQ37_204 [Candidatus Petromonas sp.]|jgi:radical SAM superfamily enzyme YgiQ (UPF0313 family)|nr:hypothetical protein [Candidatus Petromonas sp.]
MRENVDVLLVRLPLLDEEEFLRESSEYLGFGYLSSGLRKNGFSVKILDFYLQQCSIEQVISKILEYNAKIIGFTIVLQDLIDSCKVICSQLRKNKVQSHITCGGHLPTLKYIEILNQINEIDSIVRFEGEVTIVELTQHVVQGKDWTNIKGIAYRDIDGIPKSNTSRPLIKDLDKLDFADRDTLSIVIEKGGPAGILSSRGCYGRCSFCSIYSFYNTAEGNNWRARSPKDVVDEIEYIYKKYKVKYFRFFDDDFIGPGEIGKKRAYDIAQLIIDRNLEINYYIETRVNDVDYKLFQKLKQSGLDRVFIGVEAGSEKILEEYNKDITIKQQKESIEILKCLGIKVIAGFMMFNPYLTLDKFKENFYFLIKYDLLNFFNLVSFFTVLGGTPMEEKLRQEGLLIQNDYRKGYNIIDNKVAILYRVLSIGTKPLEKLYIQIKKANNSFYISKANIDIELYDEINRQLNKYLLEITESILTFIEKLPNENIFDSEVDKKAEEYYNESLNFTESLLFLINIYNTATNEGGMYENSSRLSV